jgi:hypothetical protein
VKQPHYFSAWRVADAIRPSFRIGPEICNFLLPDTIIEVSSRDGRFSPKQLGWEGITGSVDVTSLLDTREATRPRVVWVPESAVKTDEVSPEKKNEPGNVERIELPVSEQPPKKGTRRALGWIFVAVAAALGILTLGWWVEYGQYPGRLSLDFSDNLIFKGPQGGPFEPGPLSVVLSNSGGYRTRWTSHVVLDNSPNWLDVSPEDGTIGAGGSVTVLLRITGGAPMLSRGTHNATVWFDGEDGPTVGQKVELIVTGAHR